MMLHVTFYSTDPLFKDLTCAMCGEVRIHPCGVDVGGGNGVGSGGGCGGGSSGGGGSSVD